MASKKPPKKNPKKASIDNRRLHEPIILDLIAGLPINEIATRHKRHRSNINEIFNANKDRITEGREELEKAREEAIQKAFEEERERTARLITKTGELMEEALDIAINALKTGEMGIIEVSSKKVPHPLDKTKTVTEETTKKAPIATLDEVRKLFTDMRKVLVNYQRNCIDESSKI